MSAVSILSRYTARQVLAHVAGVLAVVLGIFFVRRFGVLLDEAAEGSVPIRVVFSLLGLRTVMALPSLLPVVLYLAVLLALGRFHRDREMTALAACGVAPLRMRRSILGFALIAAVPVAGLAFSARPWAARQYEGVKWAAQAGMELGSMIPGRFYEIDGGAEQVVFSEERAATDPRVMKRVFIQERREGQLSVLVAKSAVEHRDERQGERILRLFDGHRYEIGPDSGDYQITRYKELVMRTPLGSTMAEGGEEKTRANLALIRSSDPRDTAELQWRIGMPLSAVLLMMLAIPLSRVDPRRGKYARALVAVLIYVVYRHLLGVAKSWVADGAIPPFPGMWAAHGACLATAVAMLVWEDHRLRGQPGHS